MAMTGATPLTRHAGTAEPAIRRIGTEQVWRALREGWEDFRANPTQLLFLAVIYPVIGLVAANAAAGGHAMPLVWPMVSGFALVGPVAAVGIQELSRRRERGEAVGWLDAFGVLRSPNIGGIVVVAVVLMAVFVAWLMTAQAIYDGLFAGARPASVQGFLDQVMRTPEGQRLMLWGNLAGLAFAAGVLVLSVVSIPMLLDRPEVGPGTAMRASVRAVAANPVPMALWGLIVAGLLFLGSLPFFVGLAVALPVLGHGTWHLYRAVSPR